MLAVQGVTWFRADPRPTQPPPTGDLLLTNYRVLFAGTEPRGADLTVPLTDVHGITTRSSAWTGSFECVREGRGGSGTKTPTFIVLLVKRDSILIFIPSAPPPPLPRRAAPWHDTTRHVSGRRETQERPHLVE